LYLKDFRLDRKDALKQLVKFPPCRPN